MPKETAFCLSETISLFLRVQIYKKVGEKIVGSRKILEDRDRPDTTSLPERQWTKSDEGVQEAKNGKMVIESVIRFTRFSKIYRIFAASVPIYPKGIP